MRLKRSFTEPVPKEREAGLAKAGIAAFHGRASFVGPSTIQVGDDVLEGRFVLIATGRKPADLKIPGTEHLTNSEQFLELDRLPPRILFIGGGYVAFEFAHVALRAGSHVTILHRGARPLPLFDPDLVDQLVKHTRELGADIQLGSEAVGIEKVAGALTVRASTSSEQRTFDADLVIHAAGREPDIADLDLDAAGIKWDKRGVKVNGFLQSDSNPAVYAAGDAVASGGPPLTPVAAYDGMIVAANLLKGNHQEPSYLGIPTVVFTIPSLASVGLSESKGSEHGLKFHVKKQVTANWYQSRRVAEAYSGYKVIVEEETDHILGAHLLGDGAEEVINLFAVAMRSGMRASELRHQLFAYPTHASDVPHML
jgi:glutathione reductase (NADPH)